MPIDRRLVRKESFRYHWLKNYLDWKGYSVYPTEIICSLRHCPDQERNFIVDVGAFKNDSYYAFEYKSSGDQLLRAIAQIKNYSVSFDFVVVVAEIPRRDMSVNLSRGIRIRDLTKLGAGIWTVQFNRNPYKPDTLPKFTELLNPKRQSPHPENKDWIERKFKRYVWGIPVVEDPHQKTMKDFINLHGKNT